MSYLLHDGQHVPAPNPETFWDFTAGQTRSIGEGPSGLLTFRVNEIHETWIQGTETLGDQVVDGELRLDQPVVITENRYGDPDVTLTLRRVSDGKAYIQVCANPDISVITRRDWIGAEL